MVNQAWNFYFWGHTGATEYLEVILAGNSNFQKSIYPASKSNSYVKQKLLSYSDYFALLKELICSTEYLELILAGNSNFEMSIHPVCKSNSYVKQKLLSYSEHFALLKELILSAIHHFSFLQYIFGPWKNMYCIKERPLDLSDCRSYQLL